MKIRMTLEFDEEDRLVVSNYYGDKKPASRATLITWVESVISANLEALSYDLDKALALVEGEQNG